MPINDTSFGSNIIYQPSFERFVTVSDGTFNNFTFSFRDQNLNEIYARDPNVSITLIIRPNIGADFGAYRCGFSYLSSHRNNLEVVLIANDSLHYSTNCKSGLSSLLDPASSINCLFLNFQEVVHAGSMLLKFDSVKLNEDTFWEFWDKYYCSNSKRKTIRNGEHKLSFICGISSFRPITETLLAKSLPEPNPDHELQFLRWAQRSDKEFFNCYSKLKLGSSTFWGFAFRFGIENFQVSNSLGLYLTNYFDLPIKLDLIKNGLVSRSAFTLATQSNSGESQELQELNEIFDRQTYSGKRGLREKLRRF
jgi:hypothetical protein